MKIISNSSSRSPKQFFKDLLLVVDLSFGAGFSILYSKAASYLWAFLSFWYFMIIIILIYLKMIFCSRKKQKKVRHHRHPHK